MTFAAWPTNVAHLARHHFLLRAASTQAVHDHGQAVCIQPRLVLRRAQGTRTRRASRSAQTRTRGLQGCCCAAWSAAGRLHATLKARTHARSAPFKLPQLLSAVGCLRPTAAHLQEIRELLRCALCSVPVVELAERAEHPVLLGRDLLAARSRSSWRGHLARGTSLLRGHRDVAEPACHGATTGRPWPSLTASSPCSRGQRRRKGRPRKRPRHASVIGTPHIAQAAPAAASRRGEGSVSHRSTRLTDLSDLFATLQAQQLVQR